MAYLETAKQYTGNDVDKIFFRPMLTGPSAEELGIRILYNMPIPTTVQVWSGSRIVLQPFTERGWTGGDAAQKYQKTIDMHRVKAEMSYSAADYFSLVYEQIAAHPDINYEDLSGSVLEEIETSLFKEAIAENLRTTMWIGDTSSGLYNTFNGFLTQIHALVKDDICSYLTYTLEQLQDPAYTTSLFDEMWENLPSRMKDLKHEGQLAFFVSSDIYHKYEKFLDQMGAEASYAGVVDGRNGLTYHGIPVVDISLNSYLPLTSLHQSFVLLTDRRNLALAVNTADMPGNEVRMWYNPDEMENRQRAVFMVGCEILDEEMFLYAFRDDE